MFQLACDAILFDLDGVLIDSSQVIVRQWTRWAARHGVEMLSIERIYHGRRATEIIAEVAPHLDLATEVQWLRNAETEDVEGVIAQPGAADLLKSLPATAWAIATSGPRPVALARIAATGLPLPDAFVNGDDVQRGKPNPDPYLLAAERLGIAPERCVVIEDAVAGIHAGLAAGAQVIAVPTSHPPHELTDATALIPRLADLRVTVQEGTDFRLLLGGPTLAIEEQPSE